MAELTETKIAGTKIPGQSREIYKGVVTGAAALAGILTPGRPFKLLAARLHLSAAPTTSENLTFTLDSGIAAAYDTVLYSRDMSVGSLTDLLIAFGGDEHIFESDDHIDIAWTNTNTKTYGLVVIYELL